MTAPRILVLFAHPSIDRSEVNSVLLDITRQHPGVTLVDLYAEYPSFHLDIDREQARLLQHDIVVFMHPLYWFSTPALLKEWQDLVLEYGFAYGQGGTALHGKVFFHALTAGGPEHSYQVDGYHQATLEELLRPLEHTMSMCGFHYLPPFVLFGARTAVEEGRVEVHVQQWQQLLQALCEESIDLVAARDAARLNDLLPEITE